MRAAETSDSRVGGLPRGRPRVRAGAGAALFISVEPAFRDRHSQGRSAHHSKGCPDIMRVAVFGANGPTGRHLTDQALAAGHEVVAVTRRPGSLPARPGLTVAVADATDPAAVGAALGGTDAVLSALGSRFSKETITTYSASATAITGAMARHGIKRLLTVSSSI